MHRIWTLFPTSFLLRVCLIGVAVIIALMPVHALISTWGGTAIGPLEVWKAWKEILLVGLFGVLAVWLVRHPHEAQEVFRDKLILLIGSYAVLTIGAAVLSYQSTGFEATMVGIAANLRYLLIFCIVYVVFRFGGFANNDWSKIVLRFLFGVGVVLGLIGLLQVSVIPKEFLSTFGYEKNVTIAPFTLIDDNPDALRAFATLRGPNDYGAFLILPLLVSLVIGLRHRVAWLGSIIIVAGLIASSSRSAWLGTLAAIAVLAVLWYGRRFLTSKKLLLVTVAGFVAGLVLVYSAMTIPALRLAVFHSSPGDSSLTEGSTDAHWQATSDGIARVIASPLGCGPGCSGPASYYGDSPKIAENYFVQIAEEVGIVGLGLFITILIIMAVRLYGARSDILARLLLAGGAGIIVIGIWLHVLSDDPLSLTFFALIGMVLGMAAGKARQKHV